MAKRQSIESGANTTRVSQKRQKLSNGTESTSINEHSRLPKRDVLQEQTLSQEQTGGHREGHATRRFDKITQLTDEIFESPATIGDHIDSVGEDVMRLALELNLKLREWREAQKMDPPPIVKKPDTLEIRAHDPKLLETFHATHHKAQHRPPPLPPITNPTLRQVAFTHQGSLHSKHSGVQTLSYERLEFLGDAYIELISTRIIFSRFPHLSAGRLTQLRETMVKNETLHEYALDYQFDQKVQMSGDLQQGNLLGKTKVKIMADVFEAYVAALVLSDPVKGFTKAEEWLTELWALKLLHPERAFETTKEAMQDLTKKIIGGGPTFKLDYRDVPSQNMPIEYGTTQYQIDLYFTGWGWKEQYLGTGSGISKKAARQRAAKCALENKPLIDDIAAAKQAALAS